MACRELLTSFVLNGEEFEELKKEIKTRELFFLKKLKPISKDQRCERCKETFFINGCPHCGNTFLRREILRQTF